MSFDGINEIIDYLESKKKIAPADVSFVIKHLLLIKEEQGTKVLSHAKIYLNSQLTYMPVFPSLIAIFAILFAAFFSFGNLFSSVQWLHVLFSVLAVIIVICCLVYTTKILTAAHNTSQVSTMIIGAIDEILNNEKQV